MNKTTIVILIVAGVLVLVGGAICFMAFISAGRTWSVFSAGASAENVERKTMEIADEVTALDIKLLSEDIAIRESEDSSFRIDYNESEKLKHDISVSDGVLRIEEKREGLNITFGINVNVVKEPDIVLYVPEGTAFESVGMDITTGDVLTDSELNADEVDIKIVTGDINLRGKSILKADIRITTGDITLEGYKDIEELSVKLNTGDAIINDVTCEESVFDLCTGDLTADSFDASDLDIKIVTGDLRMDLISESEYDYDLDTTTGDIDYPGNNQNAYRLVKADLVTGDIKIA